MKITKRELHRLLGEAKKKPKADDSTQKTRPDGYTDLPAFMTHGRQSPTKYSGYGAQLGAGVIDDPAVADPEGDNIDADALRVVRQLQARGAGQKEDKKKIKEGSMSVTRKEIRRLVNEALNEMGREDPNYFSDEFEDGSEDPNYFDTDYDDESASDDGFMDYDPEEIPDMDDQYDPEYYEGLEDEEDDSWMDYETGDDDVPYGAADVALRMGRGYRTDEGDDLYEGDSQGDDDMGYEDDADYEHAYSMGGGSDEEGFAIDYDTGRPSPFAAKMFGQPAAGADDIEGGDADEDVFGDDDMGRRGAMDDYRHAYKLGGGRDEDGFAADYDTGKRSSFPSARGGINEARWAKLAGILKG